MDFLLESFVLDKKECKEQDLIVDVFTKDLGRIEVKVISGQKINSKLAPHLQPGYFSLLKIVLKKEYKITDALRLNEFSLPKTKSSLKAIIRFVYFFRELTVFQQPDYRLFYFIKDCLRKKTISYSKFLSLLGYDPIFSYCVQCGKPAQFFLVREQIFLCSTCSQKFKNEILLKIHDQKLE